jgi:hypothetical protein
MAYDYLDQDIQATAIARVRDDDSFFNPSLGHNGFAADGTRYTVGIQDGGPIFATWYSEAPGPFRGSTPAFPNQALILLSKAALTILDETTRSLNLWMQFLVADVYALTNNFDNSTNGWTPKDLTWADGVISVTYVPDKGSSGITSPMVVNIDFTRDAVYLDVSTP